MMVGVTAACLNLPTLVLPIWELNWRRCLSLACCRKPGLDDKKQICRVKCDRFAVLSPSTSLARFRANPRR